MSDFIFNDRITVNTGISTPVAAITNSGPLTATSLSAAQITVTAGNSDIPAISPVNDTNTGIFFPAADTIAFSEGGTESMRIDSSGNVGIGNSSPVVLLDLGTQGSKQGYLRFRSTGSGSREANIYSPSTGGLTIDTNSYSFPISMLGSEILLSTGASGTERLRIDSSGNVGIGTTSPTNTLSIVGSSPTSLLKANSTGGAYSIFQNSGSEFYVGKNDSAGNSFATDAYANIIFGAGSRPIAFGTNLTERLRITGDGEVYIAGTTDQGAYNLQVNGTGVWGAGAYVNGSDERLKENIQNITSGLDVVEKLRPVSFQYKEDYTADRSVQSGFIAQDLLVALEGKNYLEGVVSQGPAYYNVAYQNLIPILTKAIKELKAENENLKTRITALEVA